MVNLASTQSPKDLLEFLKGHRMFNKQDPATLTNLAGSLEVVSLDSGDFLFHENDLVDSVYIVADGHVFKVKEIDDNTDERNRKSLRMGSIVGCIGTSEQQDGVQVGYALRVSSLDDPATLIKIPRRSLHELMESEPSIKDLVKELEDSRWRTW
jgi:signal-transduction protein with cAMP-binding, CBS, and nucleotidyltransferase domain